MINERLKELKEYFNLDNIKFDFVSDKDLIYHLLNFNQSKHEDNIDKYLFFIIDWNIRNLLKSKYRVNNIYLTSKIKTILPVKNRRIILSEIKNKVGLEVPQTFISYMSFIITSLHLGLLMYIYWSFMIKNVDLLMSIPFLINIGISITLSASPLLFFSKLFPTWYGENYFIKIDTYENFIQEVVSLNKGKFINEDQAFFKSKLAESIQEFCNSDMSLT